MAVNTVGGLAPNLLNTPGSAPSSGQTPAGSKAFADTLRESIGKVEEMQRGADQAVNDLAVGRTRNLHETMITVEQADIAFRMLMAVRSKVISAYHEVMRMQF